MFPQWLSENPCSRARWMIGGPLHHDMLSFVLSKVNSILVCFSAKRRAARVLKDSSKHSLALLIIRMQDNVCEIERQLIDQRPTPLGIARFATQDMSMMAQIKNENPRAQRRVRCAT